MLAVEPGEHFGNILVNAARQLPENSPRTGLVGAPVVLGSLNLITLPLLSHTQRSSGDHEKAVLLGLCLATSVYGVAIASEPRHSAIVDMPRVATLTHASPDTWHTLPPVHPNDEPPSSAQHPFSPQSLMDRLVLLNRCDSSDQLRNSLSLVELTLTIPREGD